MQLKPPEPLSDHHLVGDFDCGKADLNHWLVQRSRASEGRTARTFVVSMGNHVIGFYCLSMGSVVREHLPRTLRRNTPESVPICVIGRLAIDRRYQNRGLGKGLLKDAILRCLSVATEVGVLAIIVHVIDDSAVPFYKRYGFIQSPTNSRTFILPLATASACL